MLKGLYTSIFGATDEGIFDILYSRHGASPPVKRTDIRLGDYGQNEEDEEVAAPTAAATAPGASASAPIPSVSSPGGFFAQDIGGFPLWLVGVGFLGFAWAFRRKRKKQSSRRR